MRTQRAIEVRSGTSMLTPQTIEVAKPTSMPPALADGNNWAIRTIINKYREEFEKRVKPSFVPVKMTVGAKG